MINHQIRKLSAGVLTLGLSIIAAQPDPVAPPGDAAQTAISTVPGLQGNGTVFFKFLSSKTGLAIKPKRILVDDQPANFKAAEGALAALEMPSGQHTVTVEAEGYQPITMTLNVDGPQTPLTEIELDPDENISQQELAPGTAILEGTVADADTAEPIDGARASLPSAGLTTRTAAEGQFQFTLNTGPTTAESRPAITLEVAAQGYQPMRLKNITLAPESRTRIPVKLSRATSATLETMDEIDESVAPGAAIATDWVFDVTFR